VALSPDQYQRGSVLESDGDHYDVRGAVSAEGGGRFLVIGTLGRPQAGLVSEDVIRDNEDDRYTPLSPEDAADARRAAYDQRNDQATPAAAPEPTPDTGGTDGTPTGDIPTAAPDQPTDRTTVGTVPDAGGTPDSTAPATAGAEGADAQPADTTQSNQ
jgi:hypothetical protein